MNIAIFTDVYEPITNGVVTSINQLRDGMRAKGHKVYIFAPSYGSKNTKGEGLYRFPNIVFDRASNNRLSIIYKKKLYRMLENFEVDIIHCHTEFAFNWASKKCSKKLSVPLVQTTHTMWDDYLHYMKFHKLFFKIFPSRSVLTTIIYNKTKIFIHPTLKAKIYYSDIIDSDAITKIIPSGVDTNYLKKETDISKINSLKKKYGIDENDKVILYVGRIALEKRLIPLIDSLKSYLENNNNVKMLIVGNGHIFEDIYQYCKKNNLLDKIIFTGFVPWESLKLYYSLGDVFVTASTSETQGLTVLEACLMEIPVICRKDLAYDLMIQDGVNGFQINSDEDFEKKVDFLLKNDEFRIEMGKKGRVVCEKFSIENYVKQIEDFYKEIIDSNIGIIKY